uniref:Eukaryotic translation initiation factor 3 subunit B n=1 Tax=Chromera velia CCMP2878 TaxID=1169474 RepID=A0A0G4HRS4_9ALVE|eukprot:Cvel_8148.t1-p1 / transcript=Cvel_8148.t1 / gene=Cvel_8148 / organism=Chromera_velia_CCMP2878 / gene_product=Eukaryotic translation initiation factor 3 subunit, putative / transcript_product=Eukaryotic translation initiation factor 3 subunit, putative / location=Cvel_scaffold443:50883-54639(-) / protein_length=722 / sequence_SO=supercontig / SO=protein_coding / is_pseudo=false
MPSGDEDLLEYMSDTEEDLASIEAPIELDTSFPKTVLFTGLPKVGQDRHEKLMNVLKKMTSEFGAPKIEMPFDTKNKDETAGVAFLTFNEVKQARDCQGEFVEKKLDAKHTIKAISVEDFTKLMAKSDTYTPPAKGNFFTREKFRWWLEDERCREQFVIRYSDMTEVFWNDPVSRAPVLVYNGERERASGAKVWSHGRVEWSASGSYLVTFHKQGIALWAGPDFQKVTKFEHSLVSAVCFSPDEEYLCSWDGVSAKDGGQVFVWNVRTGKKLTAFPTPSVNPRSDKAPPVLWSPDSKYLARCSTDEVVILSASSEFAPLKDTGGSRVRLKFEGLASVSWSPTDSILAVWQPERMPPKDPKKEKEGEKSTPGAGPAGQTAEMPARVTVLQIPTRKDLATKTIYNARDARILWHARGDFLAVNVTTVSKSGKSSSNQSLIFRMRQMSKGSVPVEAFPLDFKEASLRAFAWEKSGTRFAVLTENEITHSKKVHFFHVAKDAVEPLDPMDVPSPINTIEWAPGGTYFLLASKGPDGSLMFCSLDEKGKLEILHKDEHFMLNEIIWDPSSRFVATCTTIPMITGGAGNAAALRYGSESGYSVWSFQGRLQYKAQKEKLYSFQWRSHPSPLLSAEKLSEIRTNLKTYSRKFDRVDEELRQKSIRAFEESRKKEMDAFTSAVAAIRKWKSEHKKNAQWEKDLKDWHDSQDFVMREEVHEELIDQEETVI